MSKYDNLEGKRFGKLTVLYKSKEKYKSRSGKEYNNISYICKCDCGNTKNILGHMLVSGRTKSCGCLQREYMQNTYIDLTGRKFGRLTAVDFFRENGKIKWNCVCDCGGTVAVASTDLIAGRTMSCGCYKNDCTKKRMTTHGQSNRKIYRVWSGMIDRCHRESSKSYKWYGARGIKVCEEWHKFEPFYEWAMSHGYAENLTIDRIDVNGDYCPENCKWVPFSEQSKNRRNNRYITYNGETKLISEFAKEMNIDLSTLYTRLNRGWTFEKALTTKPNKRNFLISYNGKTLNLSQWAKETGINRSTIEGRLQWGWDIESALTYPPSKKNHITTREKQTTPQETSL